MHIEDLQRDVSVWAGKQFPDRTPQGVLSKLVLKEVPELLVGDLSDPDEYADVVILIMDLATLMGIDIATAVEKKMEINKNRRWQRDEFGLYQHID